MWRWESLCVECRGSLVGVIGEGDGVVEGVQGLGWTSWAMISVEF